MTAILSRPQCVSDTQNDVILREISSAFGKNIVRSSTRNNVELCGPSGIPLSADMCGNSDDPVMKGSYDKRFGIDFSPPLPDHVAHTWRSNRYQLEGSLDSPAYPWTWDQTLIACHRHSRLLTWMPYRHLPSTWCHNWELPYWFCMCVSVSGIFSGLVCIKCEW